MNRRNFPNIGDEIKDIVHNAVNTKDFHQLNRDIGNTVKGALEEVRYSLGANRRDRTWNHPYENNRPFYNNQNNFNQGSKQTGDNGTFHNQNQSHGQGYNQNSNYGAYQNPNYHSSQGYRQNTNQGSFQNQNNYGQGYRSNTNQGSFQNRDNRKTTNTSYQYQQNFGNWQRNQQSHPYTSNPSSGRKAPSNHPTPNKPYELIPSVPVGKVAGTLLTVFGSIGLGLFGVGAFVIFLIGQLTYNYQLFNTIALGLLPFFLISIYMMTKGSRIRKRLKRFRRYLDILRGRSYYTIKELSANIGLSHKFVLKDLRNMISIGMFPEGHIDEQETCIILNRESYNQYLELQKNMRMRTFEEQEKHNNNSSNQKESEAKHNSSTPILDAEVRRAIDNGRHYIRQIKEANDAIPGEEISRKLYRLEEVTDKIFNYVELHPTQLEEIQKFMEYYLPTTMKLVNAYKEFDKQPIQGENITTAKKEIENTFDTINQAFETLLDSLFEDAAMDVSTDISVLETMLAQEGLTQNDFKSNKTMGGRNNE